MRQLKCSTMHVELADAHVRANLIAPCALLQELLNVSMSQ